MWWFVLQSCAARSPVETSRPATLAITTGVVGEGHPPAPDDPDPARSLVPVGRWMTDGAFVGFTYVDPAHGLSAQGEQGGAPLIRRLAWRPPELRELGEEARLALDLPVVPPWLAALGPQPPPGTPFGAWRFDPRLRDRLSPDWPDDLEVVVPDGARFEVMWVRLGSCTADRCSGRVLNEPYRLRSVHQGDLLEVALDTAPAEAWLLVVGADGPIVKRDR